MADHVARTEGSRKGTRWPKRAIRSSGLVVLPKSGHTINLEEPDAFNRAVLDFLTALGADRWPLRNPASQTGSAILPKDA